MVCLLKEQLNMLVKFVDGKIDRKDDFLYFRCTLNKTSKTLKADFMKRSGETSTLMCISVAFQSSFSFQFQMFGHAERVNAANVRAVTLHSHFLSVQF